jgi:hypothetical protein
VDVHPDDLVPWLDDWIEVAYRELETPITSHEALLALGNRAKQLFAVGSFEAISPVFWKGIHKFNQGVDCNDKQKEDFIRSWTHNCGSRCELRRVCWRPGSSPGSCRNEWQHRGTV